MFLHISSVSMLRYVHLLGWTSLALLCGILHCMWLSSNNVTCDISLSCNVEFISNWALWYNFSVASLSWFLTLDTEHTVLRMKGLLSLQVLRVGTLWYFRKIWYRQQSMWHVYSVVIPTVGVVSLLRSWGCPQALLIEVLFESDSDVCF